MTEVKLIATKTDRQQWDLEREARIRKAQEEKLAKANETLKVALYAVVEELKSRGISFELIGNNIEAEDNETRIVFSVKYKSGYTDRACSNVQWFVRGKGYYGDNRFTPNETTPTFVSVKGIDAVKVVNVFLATLEQTKRNLIANEKKVNNRELAKQTLKEAALFLNCNKELYGSFYHLFKNEKMIGETLRVSECEFSKPTVKLEMTLSMEQFKYLMICIGDI